MPLNITSKIPDKPNYLHILTSLVQIKPLKPILVCKLECDKCKTKKCEEF